MDCIEILKTRLTSNNTLYVQNEDGSYGEVEFIWNQPATKEEIISFEKKNNIVLPEGYKNFLEISNGAILFKDVEYGQWGCKILGLSELENANDNVKKWGYIVKDSWLVFATWIGDTDILIFDFDKLEENKDYILLGQPIYNSDKWSYIKGDFINWIDRLIVAQGAKYWTWY